MLVGPGAMNYFFFGERFPGTFAPALRASDRPIAIACLRLFTFAPDRPLRNFPRFISWRALFTFRPLALPYFLANSVLLRLPGVDAPV